MIIVSISEDKKKEKRIAITPDIAKKYIALGFEVSLWESLLFQRIKKLKKELQ